MDLSIVIPAYNEENRIGKTLPPALKYVENLKKGGVSTEVIVVNDGSTDKTLEILKKFAGRIKIISYTPNHGKGYALRQGVKSSQGKYIYIADADFSTPIEYVEKFLDEIKQADCVIGSRSVPGGSVKVSFIRKLFGNASNLVIRMILHLDFKDTQCGFKMFNEKCKKYFLDCVNERWGYDFEFLYLLKKNNLNVVEMPVEWSAVGESHVKPLHFIKTFLELLNVRKVHG